MPKFSRIQEVENYVEVIHLEYQGTVRQYFQLRFLEVEMSNLRGSSVPNDLLIAKLVANGFTIDALALVFSYLKNWKQSQIGDLNFSQHISNIWKSAVNQAKKILLS